MLLHEQFAAERASRPDVDYFAADGHCSDNGYRVMAEILAAAMLEHLDRVAK